MSSKQGRFPLSLWIIIFLIIVVAPLIVSQFYIVDFIKKGKTLGLSKAGKIDKNNLVLDSGDLSQEDLAAASSYIKFKKIRADFMPSGVPEIYGAELNISFDAVQDAINKVQIFGPTYGQEGKKIVLTGADLERYKKVGASIACEFCCGVKTLTKEDGSAACGCAHSIMMRGLAAYLIKNHPEVSDDWILEELTKWKRTYFPKQTLSAKLSELEKAGEPGIKEILEEFPDFLPTMVGGC